MQYEQLKKQQPAAMRILENAFKNQKMAHAYMFCSDDYASRKDLAIWLAQSYICEEERLACETCDTCRRIQQLTYSDCLYIDGKTKSIKKEEILHIQEEFNKTALEKSGRKVYILDAVENATSEALNSLLKFLEEPVKDVLAILLVEQPDRILPTILSRCQQITLKKVSISKNMEICLNEGIDPLDSYLGCAITGNALQVQKFIEDEEYQLIKIQTMDFLKKYPQDCYGSILTLQNEFKELKNNDRQNMLMMLQIMQLFFKDAIQQNSICISEQWQNLIKEYDPMQARIYFQACMEIKDECNKSANIKLLLDKLMARFQEV